MKRTLFLLIVSVFFITPAFAGWTAWKSLGSKLISDPSACTTRDTTFVAALGEDKSVWYRRGNLKLDIWDDWQKIAGGSSFVGAPGIVCGVENNMDYFMVYATDSNPDRYYLNRIQPGSNFVWASYYIFPGRAADAGITPINIPGSSHIQFFYRGFDNKIYSNKCVTSYPCSNTGVSTLASYALGDPAAAYENLEYLSWVILLTNKRLTHSRAYVPSPVKDKYISEVVGSPPELLRRKPKSLNLFVRGTNGNVMHKIFNGSTWGFWKNLGGVATSAPAATTYGIEGNMAVFVRGTDNALWYKTWIEAAP